jgi:hypothetical protein
MAGPRYPAFACARLGIEWHCVGLFPIGPINTVMFVWAVFGIVPHCPWLPMMGWQFLTKKVKKGRKGQTFSDHTYPTVSSRPRERCVQNLIKIGSEMGICIRYKQTSKHSTLYVRCWFFTKLFWFIKLILSRIYGVTLWLNYCNHLRISGWFWKVISVLPMDGTVSATC